MDQKEGELNTEQFDVMIKLQESDGHSAQKIYSGVSFA